MARVILFNKPYGVLSQFTDKSERDTLAGYIQIDHVYPAGRLDRDSEGLLVLTDDGKLQRRISHPKFKLEKTYWVQVEGEVDDAALQKLSTGVLLKDGMSAPAQAVRIDAPALWPRNPPIRYRATIPTSWLAITLTEGRNRQIRRMTAAVDYPTLRLVRVAVGPWRLNQLLPGQWQAINVDIPELPPKRRMSPGKQRPRA